MGSNRFHVSFGREGLEDLAHVDLGLVVSKACVLEHDPHGGMICQISDQSLGNAIVETGHQYGAVDEEDGLALNRFTADGQGQVNAPVEQDLEQQILTRAIRFYIVHAGQKIGLHSLIRRVEHIRHVGTVDLEHAKADILVPIGMTLPFENFLTGAAATLFGDFSDGWLKSCRLTELVGLLAILCVWLNRVRKLQSNEP